MKWIGQHIWDFISRFRNDIYLEAVESGTIASGGNLGLDSNMKIVKASDPTTVTNAINASHVSVADNESENENNLIPFIEDASATGNVGLESDGDLTYNPSTGRVSSTQIKNTARVFNIPSSTHFTYEGDVIYTTAAGGTTQGNLVYLRTNGTWDNADADSAVSSTPMLGIALGTDPTSDGVLIRGTFTLDHDVGNDQGVPLYISTTAGDITATAPSGSGDIVRVVGYNLGDDDEIWFNPSGSWVEIA